MTAAVRSPAELLFDGIDMIKCMLMSEEDRGRTEAVRQAPPPVPFVIIPAGNDPCRLRTKRRRKRRRKKNPESPICEGGYQAASQDVEQLLGTLKEIYKGSNKSRSGRSRKRTWEEQQRNFLLPLGLASENEEIGIEIYPSTFPQYQSEIDPNLYKELLPPKGDQEGEEGSVVNTWFEDNANYQHPSSIRRVVSEEPVPEEDMGESEPVVNSNKASSPPGSVSKVNPTRFEFVEPKNTKPETVPAVESATLSEATGETASINSTADCEGSSPPKPSVPPPILPAPSQEDPARKNKPVWKQAVDPTTGWTYFYHRESRKTTWIRPEGVVVVAKASSSSPATTAKAPVRLEQEQQQQQQQQQRELEQEQQRPTLPEDSCAQPCEAHSPSHKDAETAKKVNSSKLRWTRLWRRS